METEFGRLIKMNKSPEQEAAFNNFINSAGAEQVIKNTLSGATPGSFEYLQALHYLGYVDPDEYCDFVISELKSGQPNIGIINTYAIKKLPSDKINILLSSIEASTATEKSDWIQTLRSFKSLSN